MRNFRSYLILAALIGFIACFGVYGFYDMMVGHIGVVWAFVGALMVAAGAFVVVAVGITMIRSRLPEPDDSDGS